MPRRSARIVLALLGAAASYAAPLSFAADEAPDASRLKSLEHDVQQTTAERERVKAETAGVARDLNTVRADMIATAKDVQDQEHSLTVMENRVADLERDAARMGLTLTRRDAQMTQVLLALERLALRPSDALVLNPLSPDDAVRSAILLRAALPEIKHSETALQADLAGLYRLRAEATKQKEDAAVAAAQLLNKRMRLENLEHEKALQQVALASRSDDLDARLAKAAQQAQDLRDLFARLAEEKARREAESAAHPPPAESPHVPARNPPDGASGGGAKSSGTGTPIPAPPAPAVASGDHDVAVTRSFAKARGTMPFPVAGTLTGKYGDASSPGEDGAVRSKGITITTRSSAQVVAPFDGTVAFAGPFRGYGQLLIIEHSEGYHTLLAGMGRIDTVVGSRVLAGEPVGVMDTEGAPSLYVELRRDGQPINPLPWLADRAGKNSG